MPSSTCFSEPTLIWKKQAAWWGSCSLISPLLLTQYSLHCYVRGCRKYSLIPPQPPGLLTTWQTDTVCETEGLCVWGGQQHRSTTVDCTLSIFFTLCTSQTSSTTQSCHLQKYSDDSAVVGCISDGQEAECRGLVDHFVAWCESNHLLLNTNNNKNEMIVDFSRTRSKLNNVSILGEAVEVVEEHQGVYLDIRLDWKSNSNQTTCAADCCICCLQEGT